MVFPSISLSATDASSLHDTHLVFDASASDTGSSSNLASITVRIFGQRAPNAANPSTTAHDLTSRPRTTASVTWAVPTYSGESQLIYSPDVSPIVSEIISLPGWAV